MNNYNFAIGIPTLNRADLLIPALWYYQKFDFPDVNLFIIDNGQQRNLYSSFNDASISTDFSQPEVNSELKITYGTNSTQVKNMKRNMGVAASWNLLIESIFSNSLYDYAAILNDDIYLGMDQETVKSFLYMNNPKNEPVLFLPDKKYSWCSFIINRAAWELIGRFDENFYPAYFEDSDYYIRAFLERVNIRFTLPAPARFVTSGSTQKDSTLLANSNKNLEYYVSKWGGEPGKETFLYPFNKQEN